MLINCVSLSEKRLEKAKVEFTAHKDIILEAKSDLDIIFRKLRNMKQILAQKYPEIYEKKGGFLLPILTSCFAYIILEFYM